MTLQAAAILVLGFIALVEFLVILIQRQRISGLEHDFWGQHEAWMREVNAMPDEGNVMSGALRDIVEAGKKERHPLCTIVEEGDHD